MSLSEIIIIYQDAYRWKPVVVLTVQICNSGSQYECIAFGSIEVCSGNLNSNPPTQADIAGQSALSMVHIHYIFLLIVDHDIGMSSP
jgi:hypothetical protein